MGQIKNIKLHIVTDIKCVRKMNSLIRTTAQTWKPCTTLQKMINYSAMCPSNRLCSTYERHWYRWKAKTSSSCPPPQQQKFMVDRRQQLHQSSALCHGGDHSEPETEEETVNVTYTDRTGKRIAIRAKVGA